MNKQSLASLLSSNAYPGRGIIAGLTRVITPEGAKEAIRKFFKGKSDKVIALNEKAFDLGYEEGAKLQEDAI